MVGAFAPALKIAEGDEALISPLAGEMPGRAEGGVKERYLDAIHLRPEI